MTDNPNDQANENRIPGGVTGFADKPIELTYRVKKSAPGWTVNGKKLTYAECWKALGIDPQKPIVINSPAAVTYILED